MMPRLISVVLHWVHCIYSLKYLISYCLKEFFRSRGRENALFPKVKYFWGFDLDFLKIYTVLDAWCSWWWWWEKDGVGEQKMTCVPFSPKWGGTLRFSGFQNSIVIFSSNSKVLTVHMVTLWHKNLAWVHIFGGREKGLIACFAVSCQLPKAPCQSS